MAARNIINEPHVTDKINELALQFSDIARYGYFADWLRSTYRRWILNKAHALDISAVEVQTTEEGKRLVLTEAHYQYTISAAFDSRIQLDRFQGVPCQYIQWPRSFATMDEVRHWADFLIATGRIHRPIKYTMDSLQAAVELWDKAEEGRRKREEDENRVVDENWYVLVPNSTIVVKPEYAHNEAHPKAPFYPEYYALFKLHTEEAYEEEGRVMDNCIGSAGYWEKIGSLIYSFRRVDLAGKLLRDKDGRFLPPMCSIEVRASDGYIVQASKKRNEPLKAQEIKLLNVSLSRVNLRKYSGFNLEHDLYIVSEEYTRLLDSRPWSAMNVHMASARVAEMMTERTGVRTVLSEFHTQRGSEPPDPDVMYAVFTLSPEYEPTHRMTLTLTRFGDMKIIEGLTEPRQW